MTWASPTPRPICPTHGRSLEAAIFQSPVYFGSDSEWKRDAFRNQADGSWDACGTPIDTPEVQ